MSGYNGTEAEIEEVDYDETDEDIQDVQGPSHSDMDAKRWATPVSSGESSASPATALQRQSPLPMWQLKELKEFMLHQAQWASRPHEAETAQQTPATKHTTSNLHNQERSAHCVAGTHSSQASSLQCASLYHHVSVSQQGSRSLRAACTNQQCRWLHRMEHHRKETALAMPCKRQPAA